MAGYAAAITIEHGIPVPEPQPPRRLYPWLELGLGDSFLFPPAAGKSAVASAFKAGERHGRKFVVRKTADGWRCWRLA
jgi:hypothetical protein